MKIIKNFTYLNQDEFFDSVGKLKLKLIRLFFRFFRKAGKNAVNSSRFSPIVYDFADYFVKKSLSSDETFEIEGFKMKRGRTTRLAVLTGEFEPSVSTLMKKEIKEGMIAFDLGANIGCFTVLLSKLVGDAGHVYAFEPDPYLFEILKENIELNNIHNVSSFSLAVSNTSVIGKFSLNTSQDGDNRLDSISMNNNSIDIKTITLDEFCDKNRTKADFIKMDIQGSEPKVFEGMKKLISTNPEIKIITEFYPPAIIDVGSSPNDFINSLAKSGFIIKEILDDKLGQTQLISKKNLLRVKEGWLNLYCYKQ